MMPRLSILDQIPLREGQSHGEAIADSLALARAADTWGFERFWLAEHHAPQRFACSNPEVLIPAFASCTSKMRIGAGGMLMPNHSPFRLAEIFSSLSELFPGRIDLGIGRAPGGDEARVARLRDGQTPREHRAAVELLWQELQLLWQEKSSLTPYPELWLLGSSEGFLSYADLPFCHLVYGHFIKAQQGLKIVNDLRTSRQKIPGDKGKIAIAVHFVTSDDPLTLRQLVKAYGIGILNQLQGNDEAPLPSREHIESRFFRDDEKSQINNFLSASGTLICPPHELVKILRMLAQSYQAEELLLVSQGFDRQSRIDSFTALARAWALKN
jgi:luciferase family oxidoreductase group 1